MIDLSKYTKAIVAAVTAGGGAYYSANVDNSVTAHEWTTILVITAVAAVGTWAATNKTDEPTIELDEAALSTAPAGDDTNHADLP